MTSSLLAIALLIPTAPAPEGVDLAKVDRTLKKEPTYSGTPHYALLTFGPKAEHRAWLVVDGETAYVDRDGDGDLTAAGERVGLDKEATAKVNMAGGAYKGMNVFELGEVRGVKLRLYFWVRDEGYVAKDEPDFIKEAYRQRKEHGWENASLYRVVREEVLAQNPLVLTRTPREAQICHLAGPLTISPKWNEQQKLVRGDAQAVLDVHVGTPGLAPAKCRDSYFAPLTTEEVPAGLHPIAVIEYPAKGGPPIRQEVVLAKRC